MRSELLEDQRDFGEVQAVSSIFFRIEVRRRVKGMLGVEGESCCGSLSLVESADV